MEDTYVADPIAKMIRENQTSIVVEEAQIFLLQDRTHLRDRSTPRGSPNSSRRTSQYRCTFTRYSTPTASNRHSKKMNGRQNTITRIKYDVNISCFTQLEDSKIASKGFNEMMEFKNRFMFGGQEICKLKKPDVITCQNEIINLKVTAVRGSKLRTNMKVLNTA